VSVARARRMWRGKAMPRQAAPEQDMRLGVMGGGGAQASGMRRCVRAVACNVQQGGLRRARQIVRPSLLLFFVAPVG